ncbi:hypothetical protein MHH70_08530 [Metasolibacillus sp. FSL H7-0170]|uniref:hypothetical protein n=1 Tax=Metasolibacillus sp. FSL H7-0170 TaxID=2921431 RepID=UPI003157F80D
MRSKKTAINFIVNAASLPITALLGLWLTQLTITEYGSDINGLNVVITQIITVMLLLEAGLGVAINSKLYKPYVEGEKSAINALLSASKNVFRYIAVILAVIAFLISLFLPQYLKTTVATDIILILFLMAIIPTVVYIFFTMRYKPLYDVSQSEYVLSLVNIVTNVLGQIAAIISIYLHSDITIVRFWIMFFLVVRSIWIWRISKKRYVEYDFNYKLKNYEFLKEMPSVISIKITSLIYGTAPILYISFSLGTMVTSVYNVYHMIYTLIKTFIYAFVNAPFNAFGQLLADKKNLDNAREKFLMYQLLTVILSSILLTVCLLLILPFVKLYTNGVTDINYLDMKIAILLCIIAFLEIIHIPSGILMQVVGAFKENKKMQYITTVVLLISMLILSFQYQLYGILMAMILGNLVLAYLEIRYTYRNILYTSMKSIIRMCILNVIASVVVLFILWEYMMINGFVEFILKGFIVLVIVSVYFLGLNYLFFKGYMKQIFAVSVKLIRG